jgi:hypothetical protein
MIPIFRFFEIIFPKTTLTQPSNLVALKNRIMQKNRRLRKIQKELKNVQNNIESNVSNS